MGLGTALSRTTGALVSTTTSAVGTLAGVATTLAGAAGGAAVGGSVGALRGAAQGVAEGARRGSRSTPAVVLTVATLGVTGLLDWPLLLAAGGAAYLLQRTSQGSGAPPIPAVDPGARRRPVAAPARAATRPTPTAKPRRASPTASAKPLATS